MVYNINNAVFVEVGANVFVIQFRKRDFAHARCIIFLYESLKATLLQPNAVSSIISAKISSDANHGLRNATMKHNVNNPCGIFNPSSVHLVDGSYSKRFLKLYIEETGHDD